MEATTMRTTLILSLAATLLAGTAGAQTWVAGDIYTDTTWELAGSPYIVYETIYVLDNATLTIEAGVTVAFHNTHRGVWAEQTGSIVAIGTPGNRVIFTSNAPEPAPGDWAHVTAYASPNSTFMYCTFEYAEIGLWIHLAPATVSYCRISNCVTGIWCYNSSPTIEHCRITGCADGIRLSEYPCQPAINNNYIYGNTYRNLRAYPSQPPETFIDAEHNWWGYTDAIDIAATIYDSTDDPNIYVTIDFDPWLGEMPTESMSWGGVKALYEH